MYVSSEMTFKFYFELWSVSWDGADFLSHYFSPKKCNACLKFCTLYAQLHPIFTWVTFFYSGSPTHLLLEHPMCQSGNMTSLFLQRFVVTAPSLMPLFDPDCVGRPSALESWTTHDAEPWTGCTNSRSGGQTSYFFIIFRNLSKESQECKKKR